MDMTLKTLLLSVAGIGVVVKLVVDLIKALTGVMGRATQVVTVLLALLLAVVGARAYGIPPVDWLEALWVGLQAGAVAIGIDQVAKKGV